MVYSHKKEIERKRKAVLVLILAVVFIAFLLIVAPDRVRKVDVSRGKDAESVSTGSASGNIDGNAFESAKKVAETGVSRSRSRNSRRPADRDAAAPGSSTQKNDLTKMSGSSGSAVRMPRFSEGVDLVFTFRDTIEQNDILYNILTGYGVSPGQVFAVDHAARPLYDLRRIRVGQVLECEVDRLGKLKGLEFKISPESLLVVTPGDVYNVEMIEIPLKVEELPLSLKIETSLWQAVAETDENPSLALKIAEIFQWQVDFLVDIREGDRISLLVEKIFDESGFLGFGRVLAAEFSGECGEFDAFHYSDPQGNKGYYDSDGVAVRKMFLKSPLNYTRVSSGFSSSRMHPILRRRLPHYGVDYAAPYGTPVSAGADGTVAFAGRKGPNGNMVEIRHNSVYSTYYLHLSRFARGVRKGRKVEQGQVIGYVGSTGRSTGPHLDYRMKRYGSYVNPLRIESPSGEPVKKEYIDQFLQDRDQLLSRLPIDFSRIVGPFQVGDGWVSMGS